MLAAIASATLVGIDGHPVTVEVHVSAGLPGFTVVGLPDASCRESRDRVRAALLSSGEAWPQRRITVNLAPSGLPKGGAGLDLPIAVGVLVADGRLPAPAVAPLGLIGELGLDGTIRPVPGALGLVAACRDRTVVIATGNLAEARLVRPVGLRPVGHLAELVAAVRGRAEWPPVPESPPDPPLPPVPDLAEIRGQPVARLALEVAAAGGHHLLLVGPPGAGKTMLARRLPGLLPDLEPDEALTVTRVHSAAGLVLPTGGLLRRPPWRSPHHGASPVALIGGGTGALRPGEVSLATGGVLFLDELGEFASSALDALRQPLEEGVVRVSRARATVTFPADFLLVAAMNPCPCGGGGAPGACRCPTAARARYHRRLSGPLLDRLDLRLDVARPRPADLLGGPAGEPSAEVRQRVVSARSLARARGVSANARLSGAALDRYAPLGPEAARIVEAALRDGRLSARGYERVRAVARTVADLAGRTGPPTVEDVALALSLRSPLAPIGPR